MSFKVADLPPGRDWKTVRAFQVKAANALPSFIPLREGMSLSEAAKRLEITMAGIDLVKLRSALESGAQPGIELRKEDAKTTDNILRAIVGRLGDESVVFEPFNVLAVFDRDDLDSDEKSELMVKYLKCLDSPTVQAETILKVAGRLVPDTLANYQDHRHHFSVRVAADAIYRNDPYLLGKLVVEMAKVFHPSDLSLQGEYIAAAIFELKTSLTEDFGEKFHDGLVENITPNATLVEGIIKGLYPDDPASQAQISVWAWSQLSGKDTPKN